MTARKRRGRNGEENVKRSKRDGEKSKGGEEEVGEEGRKKRERI